MGVLGFPPSQWVCSLVHPGTHVWNSQQAPCSPRGPDRHGQDRAGTLKVSDQQVSPVDRIIPEFTLSGAI